MLDERFGIRLFPVGYYLWAPGETRRRSRSGSAGSQAKTGTGS